MFDKWSWWKLSYVCLLWIYLSCTISPPVYFGAVCLRKHPEQAASSRGHSLLCTLFLLDSWQPNLIPHIEILSTWFLPFVPMPGSTKGPGSPHFGSLLWNAITGKQVCPISHLWVSKCKIPSVFQASYSICHWSSMLFQRQNGTLPLFW